MIIQIRPPRRRRFLLEFAAGIVASAVMFAETARAAKWTKVCVDDSGVGKWNKLGTCRFYFTYVVSANTTNFNIKDQAIAAGWDQEDVLVANITVAAGIWVGSVSTSSYAFDTGVTFPTGSTLKLTIHGSIEGKGGVDRANGGPALRAQYPLEVANYGVIGGGGGGGGRGQSGETHASYVTDSYGGIGCTGYVQVFGGGGGLGAGSGSSASSGSPGGFAPATGATAGPGGSGGGLGQYGSGGGGGNGGWIPCPYGVIVAATGGGAPGAAVTGNSWITWTASGTRLGPIL